MTQLEDLEVQEVSIVDRPANKRRFITVKSEDGMGDKGTPINTGENGELTTKGQGSGSGDGDGGQGQGGQGDGEAFPVLDLNAVFKRLSVPADMRSEIFRNVSDSMTRLNGVLAQVDVASVDRDGKSDSQLVPVLGNELGEIAKIVGDLAKKLNRSSASKADDKGDGDNAAPAPAPAKTGDGSDFEAKLGELIKTVEAEAEEMNKAGRKMASRRLGEFKDAMNVLGKILGELTGEHAKGDGDGGDKTEKRIGNLEKSLQQSIDRAKGLADVVKAQKAEIETLKNARGAGNAIPVEKSSPTTDGDDAGDWPLDMNDEKSRTSVDKSVSFYD